MSKVVDGIRMQGMGRYQALIRRSNVVPRVRIVVRMHANVVRMLRMHANVVRMHANVGDGLKNLALLDFSSVLADIVDVLAFDRRCQRLIRLFYFHEHEQPIAVDILNENTILKSRNAKFLRLSPVLACHRRRLNA